MVHLFWCVTIAVDHPVGRNDDEGVGSVDVKGSDATCEDITEVRYKLYRR